MTDTSASESGGAVLSLKDTVSVLEDLYPLRYAEDWDEPGLIVGSLGWPVRTVYCAVDPTYEVVQDAIRHHADLLITHHPLFFRATHTVGGQGFRGGIVSELIGHRCGLWVGHTNADSAYRGQAQAFIERLHLKDLGPLLPVEDASARGPVGLGRIGELEVPQDLESFARAVARILPETKLGITVAGDPDMPVSRAAVLPGSGDSMIADAAASGADVYITSDLRHHPVTDALEQARHDARLRESLAARGDLHPRPAFINTPHSAIEKLWMSTYGIYDIPEAIADKFGEQYRPEMILSDINTDPWSLRI